MARSRLRTRLLLLLADHGVMRSRIEERLKRDLLGRDGPQFSDADPAQPFPGDEVAAWDPTHSPAPEHKAAASG